MGHFGSHYPLNILRLCTYSILGDFIGLSGKRSVRLNGLTNSTELCKLKIKIKNINKKKPSKNLHVKVQLLDWYYSYIRGNRFIRDNSVLNVIHTLLISCKYCRKLWVALSYLDSLPCTPSGVHILYAYT